MGTAITAVGAGVDDKSGPAYTLAAAPADASKIKLALSVYYIVNNQCLCGVIIVSRHTE